MCECVCQSSSYAPRNPNQFAIDFGYDMNSKGYTDGYNTGYAWDANWMPGGPHTWTANEWSKPEHKKAAADSLVHRKDWLTGFDDGLKARLIENRHFAHWWNTNKGKRYTGNTNIREIRYLIDENNQAKALDNISRN